MIDDETLYQFWLTASRAVNQPQCHYPQLDTLREFARFIWASGRSAVDNQIFECPF